jgi:hypothetical protein
MVTSTIVDVVLTKTVKSGCKEYINFYSIYIVIKTESVKGVKEEFLIQKPVHHYKGKIRFTKIIGSNA